MTEERKRSLEEKDGELTEDELYDGWHFCCEWDYMLINHYSSNESCNCYDFFIRSKILK